VDNRVLSANERRRLYAVWAEPVDEASSSFRPEEFHSCLPPKVRTLSDDTHYAEATFTAWKYLDKVVQKHSQLSETVWAIRNPRGYEVPFLTTSILPSTIWRSCPC